MVPVTSLHLDANNPRLPVAESVRSPRELIAELVDSEKVADLAKDIVDDGYDPIESLIAVAEDGKNIVLEGNRRLAALKLLISPELADDQRTATRFRKLAEGFDLKTIHKVRVAFAPSRPAAARLILRKHTGTQIEGWNRVAQARFLRSLADQAVGIDELTKQYGYTPSEIQRLLRLDSVYAFASKIELPEHVRTAVHDEKAFNASTLERVIDSPRTREFLGIAFDQLGKITGKVKEEEFAKGLRRILTDIIEEKVNSRTLNDAQAIAAYVDSIAPNDTPDKNKPGKFDQSAAAPSKPGSGDKGSAEKRARNPSPPRLSKSVVPNGVTCSLDNARIRTIFDELKSLRAEDHPNASAVLTRMLLEFGVNNYLTKTKKINVIIERKRASMRNGEKLPRGWAPTLNQMLNEVVKDPERTIEPLRLKALNRLLSKTTFVCTVDDLDMFVHNQYVPPSPADLRSFWESLKDVFEVFLQEPPKK